MTRKARPVPYDFARIAPTMGLKRLVDHYCTSDRVIARWVKETGVSPAGAVMGDAAPPEFASVASSMSREALMKHFGIGRTKMLRWFAETGAQPQYIGGSTQLRPVPSDFVANAHTMTRAEAARHWVTGYEILERWAEETGAKFMAFNKSKHFSLAPTGGRGVNFATTRASSIYDMAADEIRRQRFAVHRCDERGRYQEGGRMWRVGTVVVTPEELLERAERYRAREMAA